MTITQRDFEHLRMLIRTRCGIDLGDDKAYLIESRLAKLLAESGAADFGEFYQKAQRDATGELSDKIIDAMTTNETLWFRDTKLWEFLGNSLLPQYIEELRKGRRTKIRIWSAGCSTGQEPYSIAILLDELLAHMGEPAATASRFEILGTDISASALNAAVAGRYSDIVMSRGMSDDRRTRYFTKVNGAWALNSSLRDRIHFEPGNLQEDFFGLGRFDIILLRNVVIYFSDAVRRDLHTRIAEALFPGGYFFLGAAESMLHRPIPFDVLEYNNMLYYQRKK